MKAVDLFKILLCFDALLAGIILCGFLFYQAKGPVAPSITGTWFFVLLVLCQLIVGAIVLKSFHYNKLALIPMFILAVPGIIYLGMMITINFFKIM